MRRAPVPAPPSAERLAFLEGMRGILALYVAVSHVFTMADPSIIDGGRSLAPPWVRALATPFVPSHVAVALFIVISGFSLQLGLLQGGASGEVRSVGAFFRRRALRILPAYYACLLASAIVALGITRYYGNVSPFKHYLPVDEGAVASHLFLVQNLWSPWMYKINGVLWTISIEAQLYLLFPFLAGLQAKRGRGVLLLAGAVFGLGLNVLLPTSYRFWFGFLFVVGMAAAHLAYRPPLRGRRVEFWVVAFGLLGLASGIAALFVTSDHAASDLPLGIALACLCSRGTSGGGGRLIRLLGARALAKLGAFSYSLYLMHHPIEQVVYALRPAPVEGAGALLAWLGLVGLPTMLGGAWLFSLAFERPFLARRGSARVPRARRIVPGNLPLPGARS